MRKLEDAARNVLRWLDTDGYTWIPLSVRRSVADEHRATLRAALAEHEAEHVASDVNRQMTTEAEGDSLRQALRFYAHRMHLALSDPHKWDTVSGEPSNWLCDAAGTATIEDGEIARCALLGQDLGLEEEPLPPLEGEAVATHHRPNEELPSVRPLEDWHEDDGPAMWWKFPLDEPPWVGTPLDSDWPGYHTHWSQIIMPAELLSAEHRAIERKVRR